MSKQEPKKSKAYQQLPEIKKHQKKTNLVIIETVPDCPIQEVMCKEEYKNLFEDLWNSPS